MNNEDLAKETNFPQIVEDALNSTENAIKFLFNELNIIESKLLPYSHQLVFFSEFFRLCKNPSDVQLNKLIKWFWITSYSNFFTINNLSGQRKAFYIFKEFAQSKRTEPIEYSAIDSEFITNPFPDKINFGSVRSKTFLLFMLKISTKGIEERYVKRNIRYLKISYLTDKERVSSGVVVYDFDILSKKKGINNLHIKSVRALLLTSKKIEPEILKQNFINDEIKKLYKDNRIPELLEKRKVLIQTKEREFVESFNIKYYESQNAKINLGNKNELEFNVKSIFFDNTYGNLELVFDISLLEFFSEKSYIATFNDKINRISKQFTHFLSVITGHKPEVIECGKIIQKLSADFGFQPQGPRICVPFVNIDVVKNIHSGFDRFELKILNNQVLFRVFKRKNGNYTFEGTSIDSISVNDFQGNLEEIIFTTFNVTSLKWNEPTLIRNKGIIDILFITDFQ